MTTPECDGVFRRERTTVVKAEDDARPRIGGQALIDGVMMRSSRAWAIARLDGSVESGPMPAVAGSRIPVIRVLTGLAPAVVVGIRGLLQTGNNKARPQLNRRAAITLAVLVFVGFALPGLTAGQPAPAIPTIATQLGLTAVLLAVFRIAMPESLWRFHGAEHKAVTAYESGIELNDTAAVLRCSRVHNRCGTNLVFLMAFFGLLLAPLDWWVQLIGFLALLGITAEITSAAARRPRSWLTVLVLAGGRFLQARVTTSEPTAAEQTVGCQALAACLAEHARQVALRTTSVTDDSALAA